MEVQKKDEKRAKKSMTLTERDFRVIEFILEMKFASCDEVFRKFFAKTLSDEAAKSDEWARKRLFQLERGGFLNSAYAFSDSTRYFTATLNGWRALTQVYPERQVCKPTGGFDQRTFVHDKLVLAARMELEEKHGDIDWVSDRRLKAGEAAQFGLRSEYVPDAIYRLPSGERVAFELEIAMKSKARY